MEAKLDAFQDLSLTLLFKDLIELCLHSVFLDTASLLSLTATLCRKVSAQVCAHTICHVDYLRQVVEVLHSASWPDGDPVDLVVQTVQEETQKLLSVLLAARHTHTKNIQYEYHPV